MVHTDGPLLILAGAGTGKTKTLVHRVAHLIRFAKVEPQHIVGVTFTNRAADEMRERVEAFIGEDARKVTLCTFHALGLRVLREHGHRMGLPKRFAVYPAADQLAALKMACSEISIANDAFDIKRIMRQISAWKNHRVDPAAAVEEVKAMAETGTRADDYAVLSADAYPRYEEILRACGAVDFDDLLLLPLKLLTEHEEVRRAVWKRWHYVMIDEYQDTNGVQLELARLLAGQRRNLCVVGDDDQSIYAFRGAEVGNILEFERHFPGARVVRLEENYRSTRRIIAAANAVIAANPLRHDKKLRTSNAVGAEIDYFEHEDDGIEADVVAREIATRRLTQKLKWGDFAILFRMNTQARVLEESLRERNVPYKVVGATSFFERKEVGDALAYLRAVVYPSDEIALRRILNYPTRGIGRTTIVKAGEVAREREKPFLETLREVATGAAQQGVSQLLALLQKARSDLHLAEMKAAAGAPRSEEITPIAAWAKELIAASGIEDAIRTDPRNAKTAIQRVDNLRDLVGTITRYERKVWNEQLTDGDWAPPTLAGALAVLALDDLNEEEEEPRTDEHRVTLMTLHSAKGLEFKHVFIAGIEEGILPHSRSLDENQLAEERRLMYVGITRARDRLSLSYCLNRKRGGAALEVLPSRFLQDIPAELLVKKSAETKLAPEESAALRNNFFADMKKLLAE